MAKKEKIPLSIGMNYSNLKGIFIMYTRHMAKRYLVLLPSRPDTVHMSTIVVRPYGIYNYSTALYINPVLF